MEKNISITTYLHVICAIILGAGLTIIGYSAESVQLVLIGISIFVITPTIAYFVLCLKDTTED